MAEKIGNLLWFVIIVWVIIYGYNNWLPTRWESTTIVNGIDDCREVQIIEDSFFSKIFGGFSCSYHTNSDGKVWMGTCVKADFNNNWICTKLTMYRKDGEMDWGDLVDTWDYKGDFAETNIYAHLWDKYNPIIEAQEGCADSGDIIDENWKCTWDIDALYNEMWIETASWKLDFDLWEIRLEEKQYDVAIANFNEAIKKNPQYVEAYRGRATAKRMIDDYTWAIEDYTALISMAPLDADAYFQRALINGYLFRFDDSIIDFTETIKLDPENGEAYRLRGGIYIIKSKYKEACADYFTAQKLGETWLEAAIQEDCAEKNN